VAFRRAHPVFRRQRFLAGAAGADELGWFTPAGTAMTGSDWSDSSALAVAIYLDGSDEPDRAADGSLLLDDDFLVLVNAWWEPLDFVLPVTRQRAAWQTAIDTYEPAVAAGSAAAPRAAGDHVTVGSRSIVVLVALIVRGVSFEYRGKRDAVRWRRTWDGLLTAGSLLGPAADRRGPGGARCRAHPVRHQAPSAARRRGGKLT